MTFEILARSPREQTIRVFFSGAEVDLKQAGYVDGVPRNDLVVLSRNQARELARLITHEFRREEEQL